MEYRITQNISNIIVSRDFLGILFAVRDEKAEALKNSIGYNNGL